MRRYQGDPYWISVRRRDVCRRCKCEIKPGESAFYYPKGRALYCDSDGCGRACSLEFSAAAAAEDFYGAR